MYYQQIDPDFKGGMEQGIGIRALLFEAGQKDPAADDWGAIGAWSYGLSRAMDYLEKDKEVDSRRVAVMGHSRLGKTALWTGAIDTRFAMVLAIDGLYGRSSWTGIWQEDIDVLPLSACQSTALTPYLLEIAGFRIEAVRWMEAVNELPSTRTKRYVVVARKHA